MGKKWIRMVKDFEYEAYGKRVVKKDVELFMTVNSDNQGVITVGHGHYVYIPQEFYVLRDECVSMEPDAFEELAAAIQNAMDEEGEDAILKFLKAFIDHY